MRGRTTRNQTTCTMATLVGLLIFAFWFISWDRGLPRYYKEDGQTELNEFHTDPVDVEIIIPYEPDSKVEEPTEVRFTSYHTGDYSSSGTITSSGLGIDDFDINEHGWYTYEGKVVLAAATYRCLEATTGACGKYNELPEGYMIHELYDEVTIYLNENNYPAIILDSCGASFWPESLQRYDIFVSSKESITDQIGYLAIEGN